MAARIVDLVPEDVVFSPAVTYALLELAYLVVAVDGRLTDEELEAFRALTARLRGKISVDNDEIDSLLGRFAHHIEPGPIGDRVRALAPKLPKELHELAYVLALGLAFVDHDPHEAEDRLHSILGDSLEIPPERRAALSSSVALDGGRAVPGATAS
jgi:hypothetical protein